MNLYSATSKNIYVSDEVSPTQPYIYQSYPKWITLSDGSRLIVNDLAEHTQHLSLTTPVSATEPTKRELRALKRAGKAE